MAERVVKNKWDGGHAEDIRTHSIDECEYSKNFDIFTNPYKLIPYGDSVAETLSSGTMDDIEIDQIEVSLIGSTYYLTGSGYESSASTKPAFYIKSDIVSTLGQQAVAAGNTYVKGSLVIYKDKAFALGFNGSNQYTLYRYNSASSVTTIGTISTTSTNVANLFIHPEDNYLYIVIGTTITRWDDSTLTTYSTILPSGMYPTSITDYGTYLAIAMTPLRGNGNSVVYLWGRDGTINTLQAVINFGEGKLVLLENLDNNLFAILVPQNSLSTSNYKMIIKGWSGGAVQKIKEFSISTSLNTSNTKIKNGGKLYFAFGNDDTVYAFGKNKSGTYVLTKDRFIYNGTTIGTLMSGLSMVGDTMWRAFTTLAGVFTLMRSKVGVLGESITYSSTSVYRTTVNPNMVISHRYLQKQLTAVSISFTGVSSGSVVLKCSIDGGSDQTIISDTTSTGEVTVEASAFNNGTNFDFFREIQFQIESTGGASIKEICYYYEVINTVA